MSKEYFDEFEVCYENTHDEIITTQFKREGNRYLDRTVRRAYEVFKVQQAKVEELQTLYTQQGINMLKLQKRVDSLTQTMEELQKRLKLIPLEEIKEVIEGNAMFLYHEFSEDDAYEKAERLISILEQALKGEGQ